MPTTEVAPTVEEVPTTTTTTTMIETSPTTTALVDSTPTTTRSIVQGVEIVRREKGQMSEVTPKYLLLKPDMPPIIHEISAILRFWHVL